MLAATCDVRSAASSHSRRSHLSGSRTCDDRLTYPTRPSHCRRGVVQCGASKKGGFGTAGTTVAERQRKAQVDTSVVDKEFIAWAREAGITLDKLRVATFDGVRGMAAAKEVKAGDTLVTLPRSAALLAAPGQKCPFPQWVDAAFWDSKPWWVRLALMVLNEKEFGASSRVSGYIAQLPTDFGTPLHWSDAELQALGYPHLTAEVDNQRRQWSALHQQLSDTCPSCKVTLEQLTWALEAVFSRAFSGPYTGSSLKQKGLVLGTLVATGAASYTFAGVNIENLLNAGIAAVLFNIMYDAILGSKLTWHALCPVIDSMNHRSSSKSEVAFEYFGDKFSVEANDGVPAGAQLYITYGRQGNDRLLQFYGFSEENNPHDTYVVHDMQGAVEVVLGQPLESNRLTALKAAGLSDGLKQGGFTRAGSDTKTMTALRGALSALAPASAAEAGRPGSPQLELLIHQVFVKVIEAEKKRFEAGGTIKSKKVAATIAAFRREKRTVLTAALFAEKASVKALAASAQS